MPRYYRRRYTKVVRPKKKWATNLRCTYYTISSANPIPTIDLVVNKQQDGAPTPVVIKTGNFKVNVDIKVSITSATITSPTQIVGCVIFVPEGTPISNNTTLGQFIGNHPEYIMAWKQFDLGAMPQSGTQYEQQQVVISSRLKRNLNSGDRVVFGIVNFGESVYDTIKIALTAQYWTCAN